jgi:hypothetical protein
VDLSIRWLSDFGTGCGKSRSRTCHRVDPDTTDLFVARCLDIEVRLHTFRTTCDVRGLERPGVYCHDGDPGEEYLPIDQIHQDPGCLVDRLVSLLDSALRE